LQKFLEISRISSESSE